MTVSTAVTFILTSSAFFRMSLASVAMTNSSCSSRCCSPVNKVHPQQISIDASFRFNSTALRYRSTRETTSLALTAGRTDFPRDYG